MDFGHRINLTSPGLRKASDGTFLSELLGRSADLQLLAGRLHLLSAGLGENTETLMVRNKNEFTSFVQQGYLDSDGVNHSLEEITVLTLDDLFYDYIYGRTAPAAKDFMARVDLLKVRDGVGRGSGFGS